MDLWHYRLQAERMWVTKGALDWGLIWIHFTWWRFGILGFVVICFGLVVYVTTGTYRSTFKTFYMYRFTSLLIFSCWWTFGCITFSSTMTFYAFNAATIYNSLPIDDKEHARVGCKGRYIEELELNITLISCRIRKTRDDKGIGLCS